MEKPDKTIMKFDVGADGFMKMIYVLAGSAVLVLIVGGVFLLMLLKDLKGIS